MVTACRVLSAGTCRHLERVVYRRGRLRRIDLPSLFAVIEHSTEGIVLFDTGWSPALARLGRRVPQAVYRAVVPYRVDERTSARGQLASLGVAPGAVRHIICSHLHADHVAGLPDFPDATVHVAGTAWDHLVGTPAVHLWRQGFFPEVVHDTAAHRLNRIGPLESRSWGPFPTTHDLFGDGSLRLLDLGGHAPGQLGLLVQMQGGSVLFAADAAWLTAGIRDRVGPSRVVQYGLHHDHAAYRRTLDRLNQVWRTDPLVRIVPSHCPEVAPGPVRFHC